MTARNAVLIDYVVFITIESDLCKEKREEEALNLTLPSFPEMRSCLSVVKFMCAFAPGTIHAVALV